MQYSSVALAAPLASACAPNKSRREIDTIPKSESRADHYVNPNNECGDSCGETPGSAVLWATGGGYTPGRVRCAPVTMENSCRTSEAERRGGWQICKAARQKGGRKRGASRRLSADWRRHILPLPSPSHKVRCNGFVRVCEWRAADMAEVLLGLRRVKTGRWVGVIVDLLPEARSFSECRWTSWEGR